MYVGNRRSKMMSEPNPKRAGTEGATMERSPEDILAAAVPLGSDEDALIDDLTDDEGQRFLAAILDA
jgi:hypothetical protein